MQTTHSRITVLTAFIAVAASILPASPANAQSREQLQEMLSRCTPAGLLSEDIDPETGELWGNYPQTYSLVGMINSAVLLSKSWNVVR